MITAHSMKIRARWNSATTAKITPATRENVFASMSHHPKVLTQDSTQGGGGWSVERATLPEGCANTLAGWKPPGDKYINMLLTVADRKEWIARIQQSIAELSALTKSDDK